MDIHTYLKGIKAASKVTFRNANQSTEGSRICLETLYLTNFFETLHDMNIGRPIKSNLKGIGSELGQRWSIYIITDADNWSKNRPFNMGITALACAFWFDCKVKLLRGLEKGKTYASILV